MASTFCMKKWTVVRRRKMRREREVNTFFGVSSPPVAVYVEKRRNMRRVRETKVKPRLEARTIPP